MGFRGLTLSVLLLGPPAGLGCGSLGVKVSFCAAAAHPCAVTELGEAGSSFYPAGCADSQATAQTISFPAHVCLFSVSTQSTRPEQGSWDGSTNHGPLASRKSTRSSLRTRKTSRFAENLVEFKLSYGWWQGGAQSPYPVERLPAPGNRVERVWGSGFRVEGLGYRAEGLEPIRVLGLLSLLHTPRGVMFRV